MKFERNISILNSLLRITCGFTVLAWAIAKMAKKPWKESYLFVAMMAGMKIGEGILRYCPIVDLMQQRDSVDSSEPKNSQVADAIKNFLPEDITEKDEQSNHHNESSH